MYDDGWLIPAKRTCWGIIAFPNLSILNKKAFLIEILCRVSHALSWVVSENYIPV